MKKIVQIILLGTMSACTWENDTTLTKLQYQYNPDQAFVVDVEVIPTEDVILQFDDMLKEVNADYYNRYGIAINLIEKDRQSLPNAVVKGNQIFQPKNVHKNKKNITLYVIPNHLIKFRAHAYSVLYNRDIILGEDAQVSRVVAHEIAHMLGLKHSEEANNVMTPNEIAWQYDTPNDFNPMQIDTMMLALEKPLELKSSIIID